MSNSREFKRGTRVWVSSASGMGGAGEVRGQDDLFVYVRLDKEAKVVSVMPGHVDELKVAA